MAEREALQKRYAYSEMSNKVEMADRKSRGGGGAGGAEATQVLSLRGRENIGRMGDRVVTTNASSATDLPTKKKKQRSKSQQPTEGGKTSIFNEGGGQTILDTHVMGYQPTTPQSQMAYQSLLTLLSSSTYLSSHQDPTVIRDAAQMILSTLKDDQLQDPQRQAILSDMLFSSVAKKKLTSEQYTQFVNLGKQMPDFTLHQTHQDDEQQQQASSNNNPTTSNDDDLGVAVVFDESDQEGNNNNLYQPDDSDEEGIVPILADSSEDEDDQDGNNQDHQDENDAVIQQDQELVIQGANQQDDDDDNNDYATSKRRKLSNNKKNRIVSVHEIDAHYIQRQLSTFVSDANQASQMAQQCLAILGETLSPALVRQCENKLLLELGLEHFDTIQFMVQNRIAIWASVQMKRAATDDERNAVEAKLQELGPPGMAILHDLTSTTSSSFAGVDSSSWSQKDDMRDAGKNNETSTQSVSQALDSIGGGGGGVKRPRPDDDEKENKNNADGSVLPFANATMLDFESLAFRDGSHTMTNKTCHLPEKTWRAMKKGYEEVHVPAVKRSSALPEGERLIPIAELPAWTQLAFKGMDKLNRIQSKVCETALKTSENLLLCAPTGAGKTNVAMLTMLNILGQYRNKDNKPQQREQEDSDSNVQEGDLIDKSKFKIVYIAPMKALVQEVVKNFGKRLREYGMVVNELSGDSSLTRQQIADTQLIVTTPEKWDIVTRQGEERSLTQLVKLVIVDEIHLLHDDRGPVLESIVARIVRQVEQTAEPIRLVGLSATLPNYTDVATLLRVKPNRGLHFFDHSYRPVPLQMQYIGITERNAFKRIQLQNEICYEKALAQRRNGQQMLIFVHSRAETAKTAKALRDIAMERDELSYFCRDGSATQEILREESGSGSIQNADLKDILSFGFAIHHAGMQRQDRELVEDLFADRHVAILCCTATLAWGVNLPAHAVIIKGTQIYDPTKGKWTELSPLDVLQMMGRAGRPPHDTEGEGIILTQHSELQFYLSLTNLQLSIESQMMRSLPDHLNAEIVLGTISNIEEAVDWLSYTFLYIRMLQNPSAYGIAPAALKDDPTLRSRRLDLVHTAATMLEKSMLIRYDRKSGSLQSSPLGRIASRFYLSHTSIAAYCRHLRPNMSDIDLLRLFCFSKEFEHITVRENEKLELSKLAGQVPIPVKESPSEPTAKINILLQAYISRLKLNGFALMADMVFIQQSGARIMRALFEIALKRNWSELARLTLNMANMVSHRIWSSQSPLRQFPNVPEIVARKLERKSDIDWSRYVDLTPSDLGELMGVPKMGRVLHKLVHQFPRLELSALIQPITRSLLRIELTLLPAFEFDVDVHQYSQLFHIIVEDVNGESILYHELFSLKRQTANEEHLIVMTVPLLQPLAPVYFIRVLSDRWLHSESVLPVSLHKTILPSKFPPPTELLDLQPLPVSAAFAGETAFCKLFPSHFKEFNPIQTQTFYELYKTDRNVLVCAPSGSGKTTLADFCILRMLSTTSGDDAKCVYIVPTDDIAKTAYLDWRERFGRLFDDEQAVVRLTNEAPANLKMIAKSKIIVSTVEQWDILTRRWRQRKALHSISLIIFDELHFLSGQYGPTLEIVISRSRLVSMEQDNKKRLRMVGLSASLANAREVAEWMGVANPLKSLFNFSPKVRPVPLEIFFQSFDQTNYSARLLSMAKPTYNFISRQQHDKDEMKPVLVFVPSRKQAQLTAIDLITYHESQEGSTFVGRSNMKKDGDGDTEMNDDAASVAEIEKASAHLGDSTLKQMLLSGVGFVYEGMKQSDREVVMTLYQSGLVRIIVCPHDQCWKLGNIRSYLAVIMGTEYYDGRERRHVNYPVVDLLHMMGRASRQSIDKNGKCAIFCHAPKKDFIKKLLYDPLPIESHLNQYLHDHFNAEIVSKTIGNMQDAVDYLTWTFLYRRLGNNPNYYGLQGTSNVHLSEHLSEMVENVLGTLEESKCCQLSDEGEVSALNLGMIAAYYHVQYDTIELVAGSITERTKIRDLVEILANAFEFSTLPIRYGEDRTMKMEVRTLNYGVPSAMKYHECRTKAFVLFQMHFGRRALSPEMKSDQNVVLKQSISLIQAIVDVISSNGWLKPALSAMELSQMVVQALWNKDHVLKQIPHFTDAIVKRCVDYKDGDEPIEGVFDILNLDDDVRNDLLRLPEEKMVHVAEFCNNYPNIEVNFVVQDANEVTAGEPVRIVVTLERDVDDDDEEENDENELGIVMAPLFPEQNKKEGWWVVIGNMSDNALLALKRVNNLQQSSKVALDFLAPNEAGDHTLTLFCMSDSYMGCDQEYSVKLSVAPASAESSSDSSSSSDEDDDN